MYEQATRDWLENIVIGLNLCPFAALEFDNDRVRFAVSDAATELHLLQALESELQYLFGNSAVETTLLIHPEVLSDFADYNQFLDLAEGLLVQMNLEGVFQIASFHPDYQFEGTHADDVENYTNRSPYPTLHILREASLARAIDATPDIDQVPKRNIQTMKHLGAEKIRILFGR